MNYLNFSDPIIIFLCCNLYFKLTEMNDSFDGIMLLKASSTRVSVITAFNPAVPVLPAVNHEQRFNRAETDCSIPY